MKQLGGDGHIRTTIMQTAVGPPPYNWSIYDHLRSETAHGIYTIPAVLPVCSSPTMTEPALLLNHVKRGSCAVLNVWWSLRIPLVSQWSHWCKEWKEDPQIRTTPAHTRQTLLPSESASRGPPLGSKAPATSRAMQQKSKRSVFSEELRAGKEEKRSFYNSKKGKVIINPGAIHSQTPHTSKLQVSWRCGHWNRWYERRLVQSTKPRKLVRSQSKIPSLGNKQQTLNTRKGKQ